MAPYYQAEFLTDEAVGMHATGTDLGPPFGRLKETIKVRHTPSIWRKPHWVLYSGHRYTNPKEAIQMTREYLAKADEKGQISVGRIINGVSTHVPFRVVKVTPFERRVIWIDERPEMRRLLREMRL